MSSPISEDDLLAWADGNLDADRRAEVDAWLDAHPERRAEMASWRAQSALLHRAFDGVLEDPIPARLMPAANERRWLDLRRVAAVAWLASGLVAGYFLRDVAPEDWIRRDADRSRTAMQSLPRMAAVAHAVYVPEVRHPVEVGADQEAHLVAWLSKRLGADVKPPALDSLGYRLVGGRLLPGESGEVAQFMYENPTRQRLTLYVRPARAEASPQSGFRYAREAGVDVFFWVDHRFGYALSGDTGRTAMLAIAEVVYQQYQR